MLDELSSSADIPVIHIWQNTHLADQYLYDMCLEYDIPFEIEELSFENTEQAALYICKTQLSRGTLTSEYKKYIIGQKLEFLIQESRYSNPYHVVWL